MTDFFKFILMRAVPALISFILLVLFILPVIRLGNINIGNIFGGGVTLLILLVCFFPEKAKSIIHTIKESTGGRVLLAVTAVLAVVGIIAAIAVSVLMVRAMNDSPKGAPTTMVVLGCQVKNGRPSKMLRRRLDAAYDYLAEHEDVCVVVSGGKGDDEAISEAQCMMEYLTGKGISRERIYMEDKSTSTEENLLFSKKMIEDNGLCPDITIVTDGFHQLRADMLAGQIGADPWHISAKTAAWLVPTYWVREWFGLAYYAAVGGK